MTGGQTNDCSQAASLIAKVPDAEVIIADKGYDTEAIRAQVEQQGSKVVIPRKRNSLKGNADLDKGLYRNRHRRKCLRPVEAFPGGGFSI